jgi:RNA polymerase sigma factor for flagellar operon FliA
VTAPARARRAAPLSTASQLDGLWTEYRRTGDKGLRDRLIMNYEPLVKRIASSQPRTWGTADIEDFISCGLIQLITALDRYDPAFGVSPESYLWTRIRGAMRDHMRTLDWAPRSVRRDERRLRAVRLELTAIHGRRPTPAEIADTLGSSRPDIVKHEQRLMQAEIASLNEIVSDPEEPTGPDAPDDRDLVERIDVLHSADASSDPSDAVGRAEARARFRAAFDALPTRQREVIVLLYVKELTLQETGDALGLSESRISQIHKATREALRQALRSDEPRLSDAEPTGHRPPPRTAGRTAGANRLTAWSPAC